MMTIRIPVTVHGHLVVEQWELEQAIERFKESWEDQGLEHVNMWDVINTILQDSPSSFELEQEDYAEVLSGCSAFEDTVTGYDVPHDEVDDVLKELAKTDD